MLWCILLILLQESVAVPEFSIRLHGGSSPLEGHVEVLVGGEWGVILDTQWDIHDATVVCRQLGFPAAKNFTTGTYFASAQLAASALLQNVACTGSEKSLSECSYENVTSSNGHLQSNTAGVICAAGYSLRLSGGGARGNLQVYLSEHEEWQNVCYDGGRWTTQDSLVVCRQLGYDRVVNTTGVATELTEFVTINSSCSGHEFNLQSCGGYLANVSSSCTSRQLTLIQCEGSPSTPNNPRVTHSDCQSISVRWNPLRSDGGHPVSSYVLRYRPIPSVESAVHSPWQVMTYDRTDTNTRLMGLSPGTIYLLSVAASNQIGTGPFSESSVAITSPPDMSSPEDLSVLHTDSHSVTLGWAAPSTCGIRIHYYELTYYSNDNEELKFTDRALSLSVISSIVNHTVFLLTPHSTYTVQVRAFGYLESINTSQTPSTQDEASQPFVSAYSSPMLFQTQEAPPSTSPASFSAFLRSSVHFTWGPVPSQLTNGIVTRYIITCRHGGRNESITIPNTSFEYNITVERDSQYNCTIAAATQAGVGPESSPILFFTPPDLNRRPSAPRNVVFDMVREHLSNSRQEIIVQALWDVQKCGNNYSCVEVLGYVAECEEEDEPGTVISKLVWQYDVENNSNGMASANLSARPFTQYRCMVSTLNRYGQQSFGFIDSLTTPGIAPALSPTEIYVTDVQPTHVRLHWTYTDEPPTGKLSVFNIKLHYQDTQDPDGIDRTRNPIIFRHTVRDFGSTFTQTKFHMDIDTLLPATDYVVNVSAVVDGGGEGPGAIARFTTSRAALEDAPSELTYSTVSNNQPFLFRFSWKMEQQNAISRSMIHSGFTLTCAVEEADQSNALLLSPGQTIVNSSLFTSAIQDSYSLMIFMPANCESTIKYYACSVAAFNEVGVGPSSGNISAYLPCNIGNGFSNSVFTDPYFSLAMLGMLILVCITSVICCLAIFLFCRRRKRNLTDVEKLYSTVGEMYDENYIRMAPSDPSIKRNWSLSRNHSFNNQRVAPPLPSNRVSTALDGHISLDGGNMENPYDEIPGGKSKRHGNNPYAEIAFNAGRARDSGVRLSSERTPSRPDSHSTRPRTITPQHSSRTSPNVSSPRRTSMVHDDLPPPGSRLNMRRDSPYVIEGNIQESSGGELHASPSNITNLSGNDYVEVTANGELRSLNKRGANSSSSLQSAKKPKTSAAGGGVVLEETDSSHYDNLAAQFKSTDKSTHHYDNLTGARGGGSETSSSRPQGDDDRRKSAGGPAGESSDFLDFFDNMEAKKGSLQSIMSENDPAYVAMSYHSGSAKDVTGDSQ